MAEPRLMPSLAGMIERAEAGHSPSLAERLDCADRLTRQEENDVFDWWSATVSEEREST